LGPIPLTRPRHVEVQTHDSFCDNQVAISLANNPLHHAKTKHVDIQLHFIRDHVEKGTVNVEYCPTDDMLADVLTKCLARERHECLLGLMGMRDVIIVAITTPSSSKDGRPIRGKEWRDGGKAPEPRVGVSNSASFPILIIVRVTA
jgi:hypothetical protein